MDFIIRLSRVQSGFNMLWVIIDKLTKATYFLLFKDITPTNQLEKLYVQEVVRLHGMPKTIISIKT